MGAGIIAGSVCSDFARVAFEPLTAAAASWGILILVVSRQSRVRILFLFLFAFSYGFADVANSQSKFDAVAWRSPYKIIILDGRVNSFPENRAKLDRFTFKLNSFRMEEGSWQKTKGQVEILVPAQKLPPLIGDRLILKGSIRFPGEHEPGSAGTRRRFFIQNILAQIKVKKSGDMILAEWNYFYLPLRVLQISRENFSNKIITSNSKELGEVMSALLLGTRVSDPLIRKAFSKTGTSHLLSVSGFHTSVVAGIIFSLLIFFRFSPRVAVLFASGAALIYMALTGWGVAVQRAGLMAILVWVAWILGRPQSLLYWLNVAFAGLVWLEPKNIWDVSFQLSFLSMYGIILIAPWIKRVISFPGLDISLAAFLATYPVILFYFQSFSWAGILANLIAVPAFALILPLGFFTLIPGAGFLALGPAKVLLVIILGLLKWLAAQPWACVYLQQPSLGLVMLYYLFGGMVLWLGRPQNGSFSASVV